MSRLPQIALTAAAVLLVTACSAAPEEPGSVGSAPPLTTPRAGACELPEPATGSVAAPEQETTFRSGRATVNFTDQAGSQHCLELTLSEQLPNLIDAEKLQLNYTDGEGLGFEISSFVNGWHGGGASTRVEVNGQTYADPFQEQCRIMVTRADASGVAARVTCTDVPLLEDDPEQTVNVEAVLEAAV